MKQEQKSFKDEEYTQEIVSPSGTVFTFKRLTAMDGMRARRIVDQELAVKDPQKFSDLYELALMAAGCRIDGEDRTPEDFGRLPFNDFSAFIIAWNAINFPSALQR